MKDSILILFTLFLMMSGLHDVDQRSAEANMEEGSPSPQQTQVLTLGTFHFNFPNLDVAKVDDSDKIDVYDSKYQEEIGLIVSQLEKFNPTKIVIEREPEFQSTYDSLYTSYLSGEHKLTRSEEQQIGFRLAKALNHDRLYCTDAWGADYNYVDQLLVGKDTLAQQQFWDFFYNHPDTLLQSFRNEEALFKTEGIVAELKRMNNPEQLTKSLGDYFIGVFKYETIENSQFGPDFTTGWWFNRNLRIFRNIQRLNTTAEDRILVIYGAGHMNLLNIFFESSPEYELLQVSDYL